METRENNKKPFNPVNILIWVVIASIVVLMWVYVISPEIRKQEKTVSELTYSDVSKSCLKSLGLGAKEPERYACVTWTESNIRICTKRDFTKETFAYRRYKLCMDAKGFSPSY